MTFHTWNREETRRFAAFTDRGSGDPSVNKKPSARHISAVHNPTVMAHYEAAIEVLATPHEDISHSAYDIAMASLVRGPQQTSCIRWLTENRNDDGTWGANGNLSWYDRYICTYAAAVAYRNIGLTEQSDEIMNLLTMISSQRDIESPETVAFGGLVGTLDDFSRINGFPEASHHPVVRQIVEEERAKWDRMLNWTEAYNPRASIMGYSGERVYGDTRIDLERFLRNFQAPNDSIATAPAAGAMLLLEIERRKASVPMEDLTRLRTYVYGLDPYKRTIGHMDHLFYFVTAWAFMYFGELGIPYNPTQYPAIEALADHLSNAIFDDKGSHLLGITDPTLIPADADMTSCGVLGIKFARRHQVFDISKLNDLYIADDGYYQTFKYERYPGLSTNIHMAGVLADLNAPQLDPLMRWLHNEIVNKHNIACKWHVSPFYAMGEIARILAHVEHPLAQTLAWYAGDYFLSTQKPDGGWGFGQSTIEETGYGVLGLAALFDQVVAERNAANIAKLDSLFKALAKAKEYLYFISLQAPNWQNEEVYYAPLWMGKPLYCAKPLVPVLYHVSLGRITQIEEKYQAVPKLPRTTLIQPRRSSFIS